MKLKEDKIGTFLTILVTITFIVTIIVIAIVAYSRFIKQAQGTATAETASFICKMEVEDHQGAEVVAPYCVITVKNYRPATDSQTNEPTTEITKVEGTFRIEVESTTEGFEIPDYYWENSSGEKMEGYDNLPLEGTFIKGVQQIQTFTIRFENEGEEDVTGNVHFVLTAEQDE